MSLMYESSSSVEENDYDSADFDLDFLDDMAFIESVGEADQLQDHVDEPVVKVLRRRVRKLNKRKLNAKKALKHSSKSISKVVTTPQPAAVPVPVVTTVSTITSAAIDADAQFERRFVRALSPRPPPKLADSIFYFPTAFVNCLNSGDNLGLSDLMRSHLDADCALGIYCFNSELSPKSFLKFFEVLNIIHPDRILCLNTTNIVNNHITSSGVMKFTDCKMLFDVVSKTVREPDLLSMFDTRADHLKRRLFVANQTEEETEELVHLMESESDLVVYGCIQFQVTFDEVTNKCTGLYLAGGLTSAHPAPVPALEN